MVLSPNRQSFEEFIRWTTFSQNLLSEGRMPEQEALSSFIDWHFIRDNFNIGFLRSHCKHQIENKSTLALYMKSPSTKLIHFPGNWTISNYINWKLNRQMSLPCVPHKEHKETFCSFFDQYIEMMDKLYLDPNVHWMVKDYVIHCLDNRQMRKQARTGAFSESTNRGELLLSYYQIAQSHKIEICFGYNSVSGCSKPDCNKAHVCRGPKCGFASHAYDKVLCRSGRPKYNEHFCKPRIGSDDIYRYIAGTFL